MLRIRRSSFSIENEDNAFRVPRWEASPPPNVGVIDLSASVIALPSAKLKAVECSAFDNWCVYQGYFEVEHIPKSVYLFANSYMICAFLVAEAIFVGDVVSLLIFTEYTPVVLQFFWFCYKDKPTA